MVILAWVDNLVQLTIVSNHSYLLVIFDELMILKNIKQFTLKTLMFFNLF